MSGCTTVTSSVEEERCSRTISRGSSRTFVVLSLAPAVYTAEKFPDYPVRPAGDYAVTAEKAGLTIGVQPVEDLKDQMTYFDAQLTPVISFPFSS